MKTTAASLCILILTCYSSISQSTIYDPPAPEITVNPNRVKITVTTKNGTIETGKGFVVAEKEGEIYVATANHVVRPAEKMGAAFDSGLEMATADVTLIGIDKSVPISKGNLLSKKEANNSNDGKTHCDLAIFRLPKPTGYVWFSNVLANQKETSPTANTRNFRDDGKLHTHIGTVESTNDGIFTTQLTASEGDSGGPVVSNSGLIGMIINAKTNNQAQASSVQACSIAKIAGLIKAWDYPWQLYERQREPDIGGMWQYFEREEDTLVAPGGAVDFSRHEDGKYTVTTYDKGGQVNGKGHALFRNKNLYADLKLNSGANAHIVFSMPPALPELQRRKVRINGVATVFGPDSKNTEEIQVRLDFLGKDLQMAAWSQDLTDPLDTSIILPKSKLQRELGGSTWRATLKDIWTDDPALSQITNRHIAEQWQKGVYIRINDNNSITVNPNTVPNNTANSYEHAWLAEENTLFINLYLNSAKFKIPVNRVDANHLSGSSLPYGNVLIKLTKVDKVPAKKSIANTAKTPVYTLYRSGGRSLFGSHYAPLTQDDYDRERDYDWSRSDLKKADALAKQYGVTTGAVMRIANSIDNEEVEENGLVPFDLIRNTALALNFMGRNSARDLWASIEDPKFLELIQDVARKVVGASKKEIAATLPLMQLPILKVSLLLQECKTLSMIEETAFHHQLNCDPAPLLAINRAEQIAESAASYSDTH